MIPDYLIHKMPWIVVWIDNAIIFYSMWLPVFITAFVTHWYIITSAPTFSGLTLPIFLGFFAWLIFCALKYGYAVG